MVIITQLAQTKISTGTPCLDNHHQFLIADRSIASEFPSLAKPNN